MNKVSLVLLFSLLVSIGFIFWMFPAIFQTFISPNKSSSITYIALGDSYTIGNGVQKEERWPNLLTYHLKSEWFDIQLIANPAVSGYRVEDVLKNELPVVKQLKPDFVTVLIGANDNFGGKAPSLFKEEFDFFLDELQKLMADPKQIVLITIPDYSKSPSAAGYDTTGISKSIQEYNKIIKSAADKRDLKVADIFPLSQTMSDEADFIYDGLHPSAEGYVKWEKVIYPVVQEVLKNRTK